MTIYREDFGEEVGGVDEAGDVWHQTPPAGGHALDWWILHVPTPK